MTTTAATVTQRARQPNGSPEAQSPGFKPEEPTEPLYVTYVLYLRISVL